MPSRSRGRQSAFSSRSASPTTPPAPYDPFTSPEDPIELGQVHRSSSQTRDSFGARGPSPLGSPDLNEEFRGRGSLRPDTYFGLSSRTGGSYAPLSGRNESPRPSIRSNRDSTYTLNSLYQTKTVDADTQALVDRRAGEIAKWHVHWTTPALISSLFTLGVIAAIGHHFFYTSLNGKPASGQLQMIRYGTAFAFFVKSTLTGCAIMCNRQRIWRTFRRKAMTIDGIDGLFSAPEDPTQFFINGEMWRNGKLATVMALTCWLIPIASVMSPASLTSELTNNRTQTICENVATIDFSRESTFNFREMDDAEIRRASMSYYNTTDLDGKRPGYFDYYDSPSKNVRRLAISAAYLRRPQPRERAGLTFCGNGWNCTYTLNFEGPGYKCDDMTNAGHMKSPINLDSLAPKGNYTYVADVDRNDYKNPQVDTVRGVPRLGPPYPASLGVFDTEPVIWIGYSEKLNTTYSSDSPYAAKWKVVHVPKMFRCVMHHTNYTFEMSYQPSQTATLKKREFMQPVVDTTLQRGAVNGSEWVASPEASFIRPQNSTQYKHVAAYHSLGSLLRNFLRGYVEKTTDTFIVTSSDISETRLMDARTSHPVPTLMEDIQDLFEDMIISLLSEPTLVVSNNITVPCEKTRQMNTYRYYKRGLWIGYAVVIGVTFCFVLIGAWSIFQNGVASDVLFSRIMTTTRNPTLDHLSVGACLGGDPFPKELMRTKLRFGVLLEDNPREGPLGVVEHCCFGTMGETKEIVKGGTYAGLAKYRKGYKQEEATVDEKATLLGDNS